MELDPGPFECRILESVSRNEVLLHYTGLDQEASTAFWCIDCKWVHSPLCMPFVLTQRRKGRRGPQSGDEGQNIGIFSRRFHSEVLTGTKNNLKSQRSIADKMKSIQAGSRFNARTKAETGIPEQAETSFFNDTRRVDSPPYLPLRFSAVLCTFALKIQSTECAPC
ncbi:MAG: hypothetical protein IID45_07215 [Planctomycetes bacterium]|nr:hypothetical protein [Planctomycetota bacterium]